MRGFLGGEKEFNKNIIKNIIIYQLGLGALKVYADEQTSRGAIAVPLTQELEFPHQPVEINKIF